MTIKEYIINSEFKMANDRLIKLIDMNAPQIMIDGQQNFVNELFDRKIKIVDKENLLDIEYISHETKKGNGGKIFLIFNNSDIHYFPQGQYGKSIKRYKK